MRLRYDRAAQKLTKVCQTCGKVVEIPCTLEQYQKYRRGFANKDIVLTPSDGEIFISNMCGECFYKLLDKMYKEE